MYFRLMDYKKNFLKKLIVAAGKKTDNENIKKKKKQQLQMESSFINTVFITVISLLSSFSHKPVKPERRHLCPHTVKPPTPTLPHKTSQAKFHIRMLLPKRSLC